MPTLPLKAARNVPKDSGLIGSVGFDPTYVDTRGLTHPVGLQPIEVETEGFSVRIVLKLQSCT